MKTPWQWLTDRFESPDQVKRSTYAFMPAALEVQETPPSPIGRAIIWVIMLLFIAAIVWATVGKMDVVAVAPGKIIPSGRVKTIQPLEIGKVKIIHVQEGQAVQTGEPLITLDSTATQADADRLRQQLDTAQAQQARQQLFHRLLEQGRFSGDWQRQTLEELQKVSTASVSEITAQHRLLVEQINEYQFRRESLDSELAKRRSEQQRIKATMTKLERTLPLLIAPTRPLWKLMPTQMVPRAQSRELEQQLIEHERHRRD